MLALTCPLLVAGAALTLPLAAQNVRLSGPLVEAEIGHVVRNRTTDDGMRGMFTADIGVTRQLYAYDLASGAWPLRIAAGVHDFQMTLDGTRAFYTGVGLFTIGRDGGTPTRLSEPLPSFGRVAGFELSPDEAWVVYGADAEERNRLELYLVPSDASAPARKLSGALVAGGSVGRFAFHPDSGAVLYLADQEQDGVVELFAAGLTGRPPVKLSGAMVAGGDVQSFQVSPDGRFVAYLADQLVDGVQELFALRLAGTPAAPERLNAPLVAGGDVFEFAWASAGRRVVYLATQDSPLVPELYARSFPGGVRKLSGSSGLPVEDFRVTADGQRVVYTRRSAQQLAELFSGPTSGRRAPQALHPGLASATVVGWALARDGRLVLFTLQDDLG